MNAFIPQTPRGVILVDKLGSVQAVANNISPDFSVNVTDNPAYFDEVIKGLPFDSRNPRPEPQVLAHKK